MKNSMVLILFISSISSFAFQSQKKLELKEYYYKDGITSIQKWYNNQNRLDSLKTYYKSGELNEDFYYLNGYLDGFSFQFNKKGEKLTSWESKKGKLVVRTDYKIAYTCKTEKRVKASHHDLKELNKSILLKPNSLKLRYKRARIRKC